MYLTCLASVSHVCAKSGSQSRDPETPPTHIHISVAPTYIHFFMAFVYFELLDTLDFLDLLSLTYVHPMAEVIRRAFITLLQLTD